MQKKTSPETTQPLLSLGKNIREYIAVVQAIITAFVAIVAIVISIRTQPIVDSIRSLEFRATAVETRTANLESTLDKYSSENRNILNSINGELGLIKGELRRIK